MSIEDLKAFLSSVQADPDLQARLKGATYDTVAAIAQAAGFAVSTDDLKAHAQEQRELNDLELESAAGGGPTVYYDWCATNEGRTFCKDS